MVYIGIDNGLDGGIVVLDKHNNILLKQTMPTIKGKGSKREYDIVEIVKVLNHCKQLAEEHGSPANVVLEKAFVIPISGKKALFTTGLCYGMFQGILSSLKLPYEVVAPKSWQKEIFLGMMGKDAKQKSIVWCKRKFPETDWRATERCKKDHDGLCDATCMAYYAKLRG